MSASFNAGMTTEMTAMKGSLATRQRVVLAMIAAS